VGQSLTLCHALCWAVPLRSGLRCAMVTTLGSFTGWPRAQTVQRVLARLVNF
jgi:hypothetical protein